MSIYYSPSLEAADRCVVVEDVCGDDGSSRLFDFLLAVWIHIIVHDLALFPHLQLLIGWNKLQLGRTQTQTDRKVER